MNNTREQVFVGIAVITATILLIGVVLSVSGAFGEKGTVYRAYFKYASGLAPAAPVRYGGLLAGKVDKLRVDPANSQRIEIEFTLRRDIPAKTDSVAKITSLGALGESYLEVTTGTNESPPAPPGSVLQSREMMAIPDLGDMIAGLVPAANKALETLNDRLTEIKVTIANANDLLNEPNRRNVSSSLAAVNSMLAETRPKLSATLNNVQMTTERLSPVLTNLQTASEKVSPLLDDLKVAIRQANDALGKVDSVISENRADVRDSMENTRKTLSTANQLAEILKNTLDRNTENLDATLTNVREATDNLNQMTDTLKRKPSVLIRGETGRDRQPGATK